MTKIYENISLLTKGTKFKQIFANNDNDYFMNVLVIGPNEDDNSSLISNIYPNVGHHSHSGHSKIMRWMTNNHEQSKLIDFLKRRKISTIIEWNDSCSNMNYITKEFANNIDYVFYRSNNIASIKKFERIFSVHINEDPKIQGEDDFTNMVLRSYLKNNGFIALKTSTFVNEKNKVSTEDTGIIYGLNQKSDKLHVVSELIPKKPKILICGPSNSGKSSLANQLKHEYFPNITIYDEVFPEYPSADEGTIYVYQDLKWNYLYIFDYIFYACNNKYNIELFHTNVVNDCSTIDRNKFVENIMKMRIDKYAFSGILLNARYDEEYSDEDEFEKIEDEEIPDADSIRQKSDDFCQSGEYKQYKSECIKAINNAAEAGLYHIDFPFHEDEYVTQTLQEELVKSQYVLQSADLSECQSGEFTIKWGRLVAPRPTN